MPLAQFAAEYMREGRGDRRHQCERRGELSGRLARANGPRSRGARLYVSVSCTTKRKKSPRPIGPPARRTSFYSIAIASLFIAVSSIAAARIAARRSPAPTCGQPSMPCWPAKSRAKTNAEHRLQYQMAGRQRARVFRQMTASTGAGDLPRSAPAVYSPGSSPADLARQTLHCRWREPWCFVRVKTSHRTISLVAAYWLMAATNRGD